MFEVDKVGFSLFELIRKLVCVELLLFTPPVELELPALASVP